MRGKPSPALPSPHFVAVLSATPSAGENPPQRPLKLDFNYLSMTVKRNDF